MSAYEVLIATAAAIPAFVATLIILGNLLKLFSGKLDDHALGIWAVSLLCATGLLSLSAFILWLGGLA